MSLSVPARRSLMGMITGAVTFPTPDAAKMLTRESLIVTSRPVILGFAFSPTTVDAATADIGTALSRSLSVQTPFLVRAAAWSAVAV